MANRQLGHIDVDHIWNTLSPLGNYQKKQVTAYLLTCIAWAFHTLSIVFIGYRPEFQCKASPNQSVDVNTTIAVRKEYRQCSIDTVENTSTGVKTMSSDCDYGWEYDNPIDQSFVTEWDIVCDKEELAELTQTLLVVGMMMGSIIFPSLADKFGRKPVMVFHQLALYVIAIATSFSPNYTVFAVLRILTGVIMEGGWAATILSLETFPKEIRHYNEVIALTAWTSSICIMAPIAYALRSVSWRYLQLTYSLSGTWCLFQWWKSSGVANVNTPKIVFIFLVYNGLCSVLDESLRWVIANGQVNRARKIIKKACKWNKKDYATVLEAVGFANETHEHEALSTALDKTRGYRLCEIDDVVEINVEVINTNIQLEVKKYSVFDIIRNKQIRNVTFIVWYVWVIDNLVYYGLYMISGELYGNRYVNFLLSAIVEYPAILFEYACLARIGRKWTCLVGHFVAASGLVIATALNISSGGDSSMLAVATAFTLIGKMGITVASSSCILFTPELYPTNMRTAGLGVAAIVANVRSMIAPFSRNLSDRIEWLPSAIFGALCLVAVFGVAFIPETNGVELPQTIEELSEWYKGMKFDLKIGKNRKVDKKQHAANATTNNSDF